MVHGWQQMTLLEVGIYGNLVVNPVETNAAVRADALLSVGMMENKAL